jgi:predicted LPLAT superfamily acyltransferase
MRLLLMSIIGVFLIGCQLQADESGRATLIEEEVQKRVLSLVDTRHKRCLNELYDKANAVVDSILIEMAKAEKNEIVKPPKPLKPSAPERIPLKDTIPVSPFLPKSFNR